jgi:uncharacterized membrane protein YphA (DoxX/SURF4 family)
VPTDAAALGMMRAGVCGFFFLSILLTSFSELGRLPATILRPTGAMQVFSWRLYDTLLTPAGMLTFKCLLLVSLLAATVGFMSGPATKSSALLVLFYEGLLRSFGHFNHDEMPAVYILLVLAFSPCGDAFSVDSLANGGGRARRRGFIYGYPILLMRALLAWSYFSSGLIKLRVNGLGYLSPDTLLTLAVSHSFDNLHDTHFRFAFLLPRYREYIPILVGFVLLWELSFPLAIWSRLARRLILAVGIFFHLGTLLFMNIFFPYHLAMYLVFIDWPAAVRRLGRMKLFRRVIGARIGAALSESARRDVEGDALRESNDEAKSDKR